MLTYAFETLTHYCNHILFMIAFHCRINSPCANTEFCNYDQGMSGLCEDCPANASCCSHMDLPVNGTLDCKSACSINDDEEDQEECEVGVYHYNYTLDLPGNETVIEI